MIPSLLEEVKIIFYLIIYGIFLLSSYDVLLVCLKGMRKVHQIIIQIAYAIFLVFLTIRFSYRLHQGYIPITFPLFFILGAVLYLTLLKKPMIEGIGYVIMLIKWIAKPVKKLIVFLIYPKETWQYISYPFKKMKETLNLFSKMVFHKKAKEEDESSITP